MEKMLNTLEQRVLGALIEKEMTTPDYYPLTLNALTLACNQKSNRYPVVSYTDSQVLEGFDRLRRLGFAMPASAESGRVPKYRHCLVEELHLEPEQVAILCELLLRGPQTAGELRTRAERMHPFADLAAVASTLDELSNRQPSLVTQMARQPGQKECRYHHLFGKPPGESQGETAVAVFPAEERIAELERKITLLEQELQLLKEKLKKLLV